MKIKNVNEMSEWIIFIDYQKMEFDVFLFSFYRMPAPAAEPAPPKTELQELQLKATEKTDEVSFHLIQSHFHHWRLFSFFQSLESTRRMLALCEEVRSFCF